ncbi:MAG: hypothetical protein QM504_10315 [Pseudomonadota bacterium]
MAKVYNPPKDIVVPKIGSDFDKYMIEVEEFIKNVKDYCRANSNYEFAGHEIEFPMADSSARYVVFTGDQLIHLNVMDGWEIPDAHTRGLLPSDIKELIESKQRLKALFKKHMSK